MLFGVKPRDCSRLAGRQAAIRKHGVISENAGQAVSLYAAARRYRAGGPRRGSAAEGGLELC